MTRLRQATRMDAAAARDLLDRELPPIAPPVDCTRLPNIAAARTHYAADRERLEKEWNDA